MMETECSELEMRILAELEEAGEADALTMLNTVIVPTGNPVELANYLQALRSLFEKKFIELDLESMPTGPIALSRTEVFAEIEEIGKNYSAPIGDGHWIDGREKGPPYFQTPLPRLIITDAGNAKSIELLEARGYQWWRKET